MNDNCYAGYSVITANVLGEMKKPHKMCETEWSRLRFVLSIVSFTWMCCYVHWWFLIPHADNELLRLTKKWDNIQWIPLNEKN